MFLKNSGVKYNIMQLHLKIAIFVMNIVIISSIGIIAVVVVFNVIIGSRSNK